MWQIVSSFSTRHAGLVSNEKCFMPLTRRFPSERDHLFLMSFACEKAEDECSQWPRLANFMAESQHPLLMLVNSCPDFFFKKNTGSHTLFCWAIKLSAHGSSSASLHQQLTIIRVLHILVKLIARLRVDHRTEFSADHDVSRPKRWRRNDRSVPSWSTSSCRSNLSLSYQIS